MAFVLNTTHSRTRNLHQRQTLGFLSSIQTRSIRTWAKETEFRSLLTERASTFSSCTWYLSRKYKTRKLLLLLCMYSYTFSFTLKLTATLSQKLAKFYMSNVNHNDDEMN